MQGAATTLDRDFSILRRTMVDGQIRTFDVTDLAVIRAFDVVPRERFLPPELRDLAYSDVVLTLKGRALGPQGRVLIQPMHLARLLQGADVPPTARALVVAGATGYAASLMAHFASSVVSLEADPDFTAHAGAAAAELGLSALVAVTGPLAAGYAAGAPFDVILIPGGVETNLGELFSQLAPGGRLVAIKREPGEGSRRASRATRFEPVAGDISERALFDAAAPVLAEFRLPPAFTF